MNIFDIGVPTIMIFIGAIYLLATPEYKRGSGFRTEQTLRGKQEWRFGHKFIGFLFILYGLITGGGAYYFSTINVVLNRYLVMCIYGTLLISTIPFMNMAIVKKFGKDENIEKKHAEERAMQEEYRKQHQAAADKKKAQRQKEQNKRKMLKEQQKIAKKRKKEKGR